MATELGLSPCHIPLGAQRDVLRASTLPAPGGVIFRARYPLYQIFPPKYPSQVVQITAVSTTFRLGTRGAPPAAQNPPICTLPPPKLPVFEQNRSRRSLSSISSTLFHRWLITPGLCWPNFGSVPKPRCPRPSPPPSPNPTFYISKPRSAASGANPFASSNAAAASQIPRWMQRGILTGLAAEMTNIY